LEIYKNGTVDGFEFQILNEGIMGLFAMIANNTWKVTFPLS
jgi:hypothetical protein